MHYLALVHVTAESEDDANAKIGSGLAETAGFAGILGTAEFDPDELTVEIDAALDEIEDEARESLDQQGS